MALDTTHKIHGVMLYVYGDRSAEIGARPWHLAMITDGAAAQAIQLGSHLTQESALHAMWETRDVIDAMFKKGRLAGIASIAEG